MQQCIEKFLHFCYNIFTKQRDAASDSVFYNNGIGKGLFDGVINRPYDRPNGRTRYYGRQIKL